MRPYRFEPHESPRPHRFTGAAAQVETDKDTEVGKQQQVQDEPVRQDEPTLPREVDRRCDEAERQSNREGHGDEPRACAASPFSVFF